MKKLAPSIGALKKEIQRLRARLKGAELVEARYRHLLENTPHLVVALDRRGGITAANHDLVGASRQSGRRKMDEFIVAEDQSAFRRLLKTALKTGVSEMQLLRMRPARSRAEHWYEVLVAPLFLEEETDACILICTDVTKRRLAEDALRESETKFRNVTEQSPNMIFINQGGRITYANRKCSEVMGYTRGEFYSDTFDFLKLIAPEHQAMVMKNFKRHVQGLSVPPYEYDLITKSGERMNVVISTERLVYEEAISILGTVTDITSQKRTEHQLKVSARELIEQKKNLQEKNAALKEILAQIDAEKEAAKKQMVANVDKFVRPVVRDIRMRADSESALRAVALLENSLEQLTSEFGVRAHERLARLSPREIEICSMIRQNMVSKEIAAQLGVSLRTVETRRNHIRKKLGISQKDVNFAIYLQNLD